MRRALIVAGPTASGKSALALELARRVGGTVVNADSMQVYRELRVLTARPTAAEEAAVPHALYGVRAAGCPGSVAWWRGAALEAMAAADGAGRLPIVCGGTGLYLSALTGGIADIPDAGTAARVEARALLAAEGSAALHQRLMAVDPVTAGGLRPSDPQRVARAWEVWRGTGRGLAAWHAGAGHAGAGHAAAGGAEAGGVGDGWRFRALLLDPPRAVLREAVAGRFGAMLEGGALEEAAALGRLRLDPAVPALRAHGVAELLAHLGGEMTLAEAARRSIQATGRYTRRQATWFRHRPPAAHATQVIHARFAGPEQFSETEWADIEGFIVGRG